METWNNKISKTFILIFIKNLYTNLIANVSAFLINGLITFFLTPFIIKNLGLEAYGFVNLATDFINFATLFSMTLNSMAARFITIEYVKRDLSKANILFNSVLYSNIVLILILIFPSLYLLINLNDFISIPFNLLYDVKFLFLLLILNFFITSLLSVFSIAIFAKNLIYLDSLRRIESTFIKAILLLTLFYFFKPNIVFIGISTLSIQLYLFYFNYRYTKKYFPEFIINKKFINLNSILELLSSGVWNTIIKLGQILLEGFDLILINIFLGAKAMGALALAKTIPLLIISIISVISSVFLPQFTMFYAKKQLYELINAIKLSMKALSIIVTIPVGLLVVFGDVFFKLWVPNENPILIHYVAILTCFTIVFSGSISSLYEVFTVTNKLKTNAIIVLVSGILNLALVYLLLKTTNWGIYAIAGVSTFLSIIRNVFFTIPYGAKYLNLKWNTFYPELFKSILAFLVILVTGFLMKYLINGLTWTMLIVMIVFTTTISLIINVFLIFDKVDREFYYKKTLKIFQKV